MAKKQKPIGYVVMWDSGEGLQWPYVADDECPGALRIGSGDKCPVLFATGADARRAIRISTAFAKLCQSQGRLFNDDPQSLSRLRIVPLVAPVASA